MELLRISPVFTFRHTFAVLSHKDGQTAAGHRLPASTRSNSHQRRERNANRLPGSQPEARQHEFEPSARAQQAVWIRTLITPGTAGLGICCHAHFGNAAPNGGRPSSADTSTATSLPGYTG